MQKQITYDQLFAYDLDIKTIQKKNPGLSFLMDSRIKSFYEKNQQHFDALNAGVKAIQKKFIVHDNGEPMMETVDGVQDWKYVTVYTDFETASIISNRVEIKKRFEDHIKRFTSLTIKAEI